tara:strand:+ start:539 stop:808 length:270 start_codon:yes stop_codon:yes gene_type:complete
MSSDIEYIVEDWIDTNMGHLESDWDEAGGESGGFQEMISDIVYDVASDVESDLEYMVEDNLANHRQYEIEDMIQNRIAEIDFEEVEEVE